MKLLAALLFALPAAAQGPVSFYFAAHPDDWQLFMTPNAYNDVQTGMTVVFVHVTAGDAGLGTGKGDRREPYYLARENGATQAIRFMADAGGSPVEGTAGEVTLAGHQVLRCAYRNTVNYYLRLPDGNGSGAGYASTGEQSLRRLKAGDITGMTAVDGSATYYGWPDLVDTLRALIDAERGGAATVWVNLPDPDAEQNPGDHSDHLHTTYAAGEAVAPLGCVNRAYFVDYYTARLPENLSAAERQVETATFAVTVAGILALDHKSTWDSGHRGYLGRNYFRVERGTGVCGQ